MSKAFTLTSLLIGVLVSFFTWSVMWALTDRNQSHYGLQGDATSLTFVSPGIGRSKAREREVTQQLQTFLRSRSLTLLVAAVGDGSPQLTVYNPRDNLSWLMPNGTPPAVSSNGLAYVFRGTYSYERWTATGTSPLIPASTNIVGAIERPPGVDRLQFVVVNPSGPLLGGRFVLNSTVKSDVDQFVAIVLAAGFSSHGAESSRASVGLFRDPLVVASLLMLLTGSAGTITYWTIYFKKLALESRIRSQSGGSVLEVSLDYHRRFLPAPLVGIPLGCCASIAIVRAASGLWPDTAAVLTLCTTATIGGSAGVASLFVVLLVTVRHQLRAP